MTSTPSECEKQGEAHGVSCPDQNAPLTQNGMLNQARRKIQLDVPVVAKLCLHSLASARPECGPDQTLALFRPLQSKVRTCHREASIGRS